MPHVLILGAGMVTHPMVDYLLEQPDIFVSLADVDKEKALAMIAGRDRGSAFGLDVNNKEQMKSLISGADLVISLVPYTFHPLVARLCLEEGKNMVTASYVSDEMKSLDRAARERGIIILNEIGLDPGIDHMSAMRIIDGVKSEGGSVKSFYSYCGGLPAPDSNNNPLGYKFSWSPRGVVLAGRNSARYLKNGKIVEVDSAELFSHTWKLSFSSIGELEAYPNRDSIPYLQLYGLEGIDSLYRGTLRYPGWCETWQLLSSLGYLDLEERHDPPGTTLADITAGLAGSRSSGEAKKAVCDRFRLAEDSPAIGNLEWLGLFSPDPPPPDQPTLLDILSFLLLKKMVYGKGERDMIVLHHEFIASFPEKKERITSTLTSFGDPGGHSAMARTVSLPAAIAAHLILENRITLRGVQIPVHPSIYNPVLQKLEKMDIVCTEKRCPQGHERTS